MCEIGPWDGAEPVHLGRLRPNGVAPNQFSEVAECGERLNEQSIRRRVDHCDFLRRVTAYWQWRLGCNLPALREGQAQT
jgi:hypothetical protein